MLGRQVYSSLDLSRGHLEEKGEVEEKKTESPLTVDSLSWTTDFADMYVCPPPVFVSRVWIGFVNTIKSKA